MANHTYRPSMMRWRTISIFLAMIGLGGSTTLAEVLRLKGDSTISGSILAEKTDHLAVDVGYTVLMIPRTAIREIDRSQDESGKSPVVVGEPEVTEVSTGLYREAASKLRSRSVRELTAELGEAVVQVRTPSGLGSGFFLNTAGYLITNFHVVESETEISIEVYHQKDGQLERTSYKEIRIVALNKFVDLALLKIEDKNAPDFKYVLLANLDTLSAGDPVFAIGSPLGLERTVTEGILSTKTREFQGNLYLQTNAQVNPGNSGGPLFNLQGEVIGVINMKMLFSEGLNFAIPVEALKYFLKYRDAFSYDNDNPSNPYRYLPPPGRVIFPDLEARSRTEE